MSLAPVIVWFRQDLRLADNPALSAAVRRGAPVLPIYILAPQEEALWPAGGASRWWLHFSLAALGAALQRQGAGLILRHGASERELLALVEKTGARTACWNRRYEPAAIRRDEAVTRALRRAGVEVESFNSALLAEPWEVSTREGAPYRVFTPFWRTCRELVEPDAALPVPRLRPWGGSALPSLSLDALELLPRSDWAAGLRETWTPGEAGAVARLDRFLAAAVALYGKQRDLPGQETTARLSPHLHFGELSPRQIWRAVGDAGAAAIAEPWLRQLGWREFAHHLLFHYPDTPELPLRSEFRRFPWKPDAIALQTWQQGRTGYPLIDAGMRELWRTGWMHNRVRLVTASFLVKDLLIPWQEGARWFWDTLVDADLADNTLGWQWTAGCGADAAPYFRIFNPVSQGKRFDPQGAYVRRWVPELARLPDAWIHAPWEAPAEVRRAAGVELGSSYPFPIVDHARARERALDAFAQLTS